MRCARAFWPGGLTLVVRHALALAWDLGDADGTVAVRMPLHPVAIELLQRTGPMAVSSANVSGRAPAADAHEAFAQLGDEVSVYLDARPVRRPAAVDDRRLHRFAAAAAAGRRGLAGRAARRGARHPVLISPSMRAEPSLRVTLS